MLAGVKEAEEEVVVVVVEEEEREEGGMINRGRDIRGRGFVVVVEVDALITSLWRWCGIVVLEEEEERRG